MPKFTDYPGDFRPDAVAFWVGAAQSIACSDMHFPDDKSWAQGVAEKADALTVEYLDRLLPDGFKS